MVACNCNFLAAKHGIDSACLTIENATSPSSPPIMRFGTVFTSFSSLAVWHGQSSVDLGISVVKLTKARYLSAIDFHCSFTEHILFGTNRIESRLQISQEV